MKAYIFASILALASTVFGSAITQAQDFFSTPSSCTTCVTTYHNDNARDGVNSHETILTQGIVAGGTFGYISSVTGLDGLVYAQPLYLNQFQMNTTSCPSTVGGVATYRNIVIIATENNSVYAYDVTTPALPVQCFKASMNQSSSSLTEYAIPFTDQTPGNVCANLVPQEGITATPVIDLSVSPPGIYVVSAHKQIPTTGPATYVFRLSVVKANTGTLATGNGSSGFVNLNSSSSPNSYLPSTFQPLFENQRASLALYSPTSGPLSANIYIAFSSHCDFKTSPAPVGYVQGVQYTYNTHTFSSLGYFESQSTTSTTAGGIWMSGAAPAVDSSGNLYASVGNGDWTGTSSNTTTYLPTGLGESIVKLVQTTGVTPTLSAGDYYTPNAWSYLNNGSGLTSVCRDHVAPLGSCTSSSSFPITEDQDLGSGGVVLIGNANTNCSSAGGELIAAGKGDVIYGVCYNPSSLGSMGGLDGCGYSPSATCLSGATAAAQKSACTQFGDVTGNVGAIAQCFANISTILPASKETGSRGTPAFWQNSLFVAASGDVLKAYNMASGVFVTTPVIEVGNPHAYYYPGATPSVSWDGSTSSNCGAIVWAIKQGLFGRYSVPTPPAIAYTTGSGIAQLYAYAAAGGCTKSTGGTYNQLDLLYSSTSEVYPIAPGPVKFTLPTVANGLVFVAGGEGGASASGYAPGPNDGTGGVNCSPSAPDARGNPAGSCNHGAFYIYGIK